MADTRNEVHAFIPFIGGMELPQRQRPPTIGDCDRCGSKRTQIYREDASPDSRWICGTCCEEEANFEKEESDKPNWATLYIGDCEGQPIAFGNCPVRIEELNKFRKHGYMDGLFFGQCGLDHEIEDDMSTWGPQSADQIEWSGFPWGT